jgi:hypothetical protein
MKHSTATKLIQNYRRHLHSHESDSVVARRAEREYLTAGLTFLGIALIEAIDAAVTGGVTIYRVLLALSLFIIGALFCLQGYRFTRVRRSIFEGGETDSN